MFWCLYGIGSAILTVWVYLDIRNNRMDFRMKILLCTVVFVFHPAILLYLVYRLVQTVRLKAIKPFLKKSWIPLLTLLTFFLTVNLHNTLYFRNTLVPAPQQVETFIGESGLQKFSVSYEADDMLFDEFATISNSFKYGFSDDFKTYSYMMKKPEGGRCQILCYTYPNAEELQRKFFFSTQKPLNRHDKPWRMHGGSQCAEYYYPNTFAYIQTWYVDNRLMILLSEDADSGVEMKKELMSFIRSVS